MIATRMCCFLMPAIAVGAIRIATRSVPIILMRVILVPGKPAKRAVKASTRGLCGDGNQCVQFREAPKPTELSADEVCGMREGDYSCSWRLQHGAQQGICLRGLLFKGDSLTPFLLPVGWERTILDPFLPPLPTSAKTEVSLREPQFC